VECLIRKDGDLEQVLRLHVGSRRFRERIECL
jgi:hypothetical protein